MRQELAAAGLAPTPGHPPLRHLDFSGICCMNILEWANTPSLLPLYPPLFVPFMFQLLSYLKTTHRNVTNHHCILLLPQPGAVRAGDAVHSRGGVVADLSKLKMLDAVVKETLRVHSTAPLGAAR